MSRADFERIADCKKFVGQAWRAYVNDRNAKSLQQLRQADASWHQLLQHVQGDHHVQVHQG